MKLKLFPVWTIVAASAIVGLTKLPASGTLSQEIFHPKKIAVEQYIAHYDIDELEGVEKAIRANPNDAEAYMHRGLIRSHSQEDFQGAIEDFSRVIQLDRDHAEAYNYRGTAYFWLNQYQQALADYNQAIRLDSKLTIAYYNRAYVRLELGDKAGAIEDFRQGAALSKQEGDTLSYDQALEMIRGLE
jgi:tetratricopeptide (TPR) repeat protein